MKQMIHGMTNENLERWTAAMRGRTVRCLGWRL